MLILDDIDVLPTDVPAYVYGTGKGGRIVVSALRRRNRAQIAGVVDTFRRGEFMGMPILSPQDMLAQRSPESVILLASQWWRTIAAELKEQGVPEARIYNAGPFFRHRLDMPIDDALSVQPETISAALAGSIPCGPAVLVPRAAESLTPAWRPDVPLDVAGPISGRLEPMRFSAYRCFQDVADADQAGRLHRIGEHLVGMDGAFALYAGSLLDRLADAHPLVISRCAAIVDHRPDAAMWHGRPTTHPEALPAAIRTVFLAETRMDRRLLMQQHLPDGVAVLCPDLLSTIAPEMVPAETWIPHVPSIYPISLPKLEARPGLDMLLVELPANNAPSIPLGIAYVGNALRRQGVAYQIVDADITLYHCHHLHRLFDLGGPISMADGTPFPEDAWHTAESATWSDPNRWAIMIETFAAEIAEIVDMIVRAHPKSLGLSVHALNEWIGREVARRVKQQAPEIVVVVGGYSCCYPEVARAAFPEADVHVIGEADLTVGPLVAQLARGEVPVDMPGVLSRWDTPNRHFVPGPLAADINTLGAPVYDWVPTLDIYRSFRGDHINRMTASRGCQWSHCTFCAERFNGRARAADPVVDEIAWFLDEGRSNFMLNESVVGGDRQNLRGICEEIIRRGLRPQLNGLIRIDRRNDAKYFKILAAAGFETLCFGADAWSRNTLKLQRKGYSPETIGLNLRDAAAAGIQVTVNVVLGIPGETEDDIDESIALLLANRDYIDAIANLNTLILAHGSVYWNEPEKHGIRFRGDKDTLYRTYVRALPEELWYSEAPYIDGAVRLRRLNRVVDALTAGGIQFSGPARRQADSAKENGCACTAAPVPVPLDDTTILHFAQAGHLQTYRAPRHLLGRRASTT